MKEGIKHDQGKIRWDLLPWDEIEEVVKVLTHGSKKYCDNNWKKVDPKRYFPAVMRHILAWYRGEINDPESNCHHLAHAICCLMFLMWNDKNNDNDNDIDYEKLKNS